MLHSMWHHDVMMRMHCGKCMCTTVQSSSEGSSISHLPRGMGVMPLSPLVLPAGKAANLPCRWEPRAGGVCLLCWFSQWGRERNPPHASQNWETEGQRCSPCREAWRLTEASLVHSWQKWCKIPTRNFLIHELFLQIENQGNEYWGNSCKIVNIF